MNKREPTDDILFPKKVGCPERTPSEQVFISKGLKDSSLMNDLVGYAAKGEIGIHVVYYTIDELKELVNSPMDNSLLQKLKRHMYLITCVKNLPGEIFRTYPIHFEFATSEFQKFLMNNKNSGCNYLDSKNKTNYYIECSNFGRIKINGNISKPIEEKPGWLYIHFDKYRYPVYRFIAETWCLCPFINSSGWDVHHISNDGYDNSPGNLIWVQHDAHMKIGTPREQKMKVQFNENEYEIIRIIKELNS